MFNYFSKLRKPEVNNGIVATDKSLLLSVPLYFYLDFLKTYYKSLIVYLTLIIAVILAYVYAPNYNIQNQISWNDFALEKYDIEKSTYIQQYKPFIYEEMLKELRKMQQAAAYLQIKQQASDRKTLALQQQLYKLTKNTEILNEEKAKSMIKDALSIYDADKLGLRDYALEYLGGAIISTPSTTAKLSHTRYIFFGFFTVRSYSNPRVIIQPEVQAGKCFAFEGQTGKIRIKLSNKIFISAVTLEHASSSLLTKNEIMSAPKVFEINGMKNEYSNIGYPLGQFIYSSEGPPRQTFLVTEPEESQPYEYVELHILSNYGNKDTCVYRFRIHGRLANMED